jgi:hypothetical protein
MTNFQDENDYISSIGLNNYGIEQKPADLSIHARFENLRIEGKLDEQTAKRSKRLKKQAIVSTNNCSKQASVKKKQNKSDLKSTPEINFVKHALKRDVYITKMIDDDKDNQDTFADIEEADLEGLETSTQNKKKGNENVRSMQGPINLKKFNQELRNEHIVARDKKEPTEIEDDSDDFFYFN